jgi:cytochrome c-type biogenesis protein CcmH/NrfG
VLQVVHLQVETVSKRLAALQEALQLPQDAAGRLVLREPQLLLLKVDLLQQLVGEVVEMVGGPDAARKLVLQDPKVGFGGGVVMLAVCAAAYLAVHSKSFNL